MKTEIDTSRYEFAHGKKPSGRGSWAFHPNFNVLPTNSEEIFWWNGPYRDAKRAAKLHFTALKVPFVHVLD